MKVRGGPAYNTTVTPCQEIYATSWKMRLALKTVERYLSTCRPLVVRSRCAEKIFEEKHSLKPVVALWHSNLIYTLYHFRIYPATIMTSASRDGEWIARTISQWGQYPVRGSRLKGGLRAIRKMASLMKMYNIAAGVVADGSTGPVNVAQIGAVVLARDTGSPVIPTGFAASRAIYFNSWDRMVLPLPFSRACIVYGDMITVPGCTHGMRLEYYRKKLEEGLNIAQAEACRRVGLHE